MADLPAGRGPDLHDVLAGRATPLEAVDESGPVRLLPCGRTLAGARASEPRGLVDVLAAVDAEYGTVVVDAPAGMAADAGLPLFAATAAVLVTTPAPTAMTAALRTRALAAELDAGLAAAVVNKAAGSVAVERFRRLLGAPVTVVPASAAVARAQRTGCPVATVEPAAPAVPRFDEIAERARACRPA